MAGFKHSSSCDEAVVCSAEARNQVARSLKIKTCVGADSLFERKGWSGSGCERCVISSRRASLRDGAAWNVHCNLNVYRVLHPRHQLQGMSYTAPWRRRKSTFVEDLPVGRSDAESKTA